MLLFSVLESHVTDSVHQITNLLLLKYRITFRKRLFVAAAPNSRRFPKAICEINDMPGRNCAFFGCSSSQKHKISLFQIPVVSATQSEYTTSLKKKCREEWLRIVLRTREMTPEFKKRIEKNNIYICERHFKAERILTGTNSCITCV